MREIIQINFGDVGHNIGLAYTEKLHQDHYVNQENEFKGPSDIFQQRIDTCFETIKDKYYARNLFVNTDTRLINNAFCSQQNHLINPENVLCKDKMSNGTYISGRNQFQSDYQEEFLDMVRKMWEKCDRLFGFNVINSSYDKMTGLSSKSIELLRDYYPSSSLTSNTIFPNDSQCSQIEIYNFTFTINILAEHLDFVIPYSYNAMANKYNQQCLNQNIQIDPNIDIISEVMLQCNCSMRFPGNQNGDLRKISVNLVPFRRIHYLTCCFTPIKTMHNLLNDINEITNPKNHYYKYQTDAQNSYFGQTLISRTEDLHNEIIQCTSKLQNTVEWIGSGYLDINCKIPHYSLNNTMMHIGNQRNFGASLTKFGEKFTASFRRKAFLNKYLQEGADEMEFTEAESQLNDLVSEYFPCPCGYSEDDNYDDYDE